MLLSFLSSLVLLLLVDRCPSLRSPHIIRPKVPTIRSDHYHPLLPSPPFHQGSDRLIDLGLMSNGGSAYLEYIVFGYGVECPHCVQSASGVVGGIGFGADLGFLPEAGNTSYDYTVVIGERCGRDGE